MCVIGYAPAHVKIDDETLETMFYNNPDGAGIMWKPLGNKPIEIKKGFMSFAALLKAWREIPVECEKAVHCRIATAGKISAQCCHPFPVRDTTRAMKERATNCGMAFMHNGIITLTDPPKGIKSPFSDSMMFGKEVLYPIRDALDNIYVQEMVEGSIDHSRMLIFRQFGDTIMLGNWVKEGKLYFSNGSYKDYWYSYSKYGNTCSTKSCATTTTKSVTSSTKAITASDSKKKDTKEEVVVVSSPVTPPVTSTVPTVSEVVASLTPTEAKEVVERLEADGTVDKIEAATETKAVSFRDVEPPMYGDDEYFDIEDLMYLSQLAGRELTQEEALDFYESEEFFEASNKLYDEAYDESYDGMYAYDKYASDDSNYFGDYGYEEVETKKFSAAPYADEIDND